MTWIRVCAPESSSGFPSWINCLNKNSYLLLCPILLINYIYYHYYIPSHNRIISKFFWVITVESTSIRWKPSHEPIRYGSDHKSETTLGWMLKHMTGGWCRRDSARHLCLDQEKLTRSHCKCLILVISFTVLHPVTPQQQLSASAAQPQGFR